MKLLSIFVLGLQFFQVIKCGEQVMGNNTKAIKSPLSPNNSRNNTNLDVKNGTGTPSDVLYIPPDFHSLFVFFSNNISAYPLDNDPPAKVIDFIENSIPFRFKSFFRLISYLVILPNLKEDSKFKNGPVVKPILGLFFEENLKSQQEGVGPQFWDSMTNNWISLNLLNVLIHSTFCTYNLNATDMSGYCVEITKDNRIEMFPLEFDKLIEELFENLEADYKSKNTESKNFKIQVHEVLKPSMLNSQNISRDGNVIVDENSWLKQSKSLANKAKLNVQTKLIENIINSRQKVNVRSIPFKEFGIIQNPRAKSYSQILIPNDKMLKDLGYKINGKFVKRDELETIMAAAANEEPCAPITWYNVFHNSVFGNPKMCSPQAKK